jgi:hypothetical protein
MAAIRTALIKRQVGSAKLKLALASIDLNKERKTRRTWRYIASRLREAQRLVGAAKWTAEANAIRTPSNMKADAREQSR